MVEFLLERSSWGAMLLVQLFASQTVGHDTIVGVLIALLVAAIVGVVLWLVVPTRPWAGPVAILVFIVLLLLMLV